MRLPILRAISFFTAVAVQLTAAVPVITNLSYYRNYFVTGDYAVGGKGMRATGAGGTAKAAISVPGIPAGARILAAFLYWETAGDGRNGKFNTKPIAGDIVGTTSSPCELSSTINVYRADVLQYLNVSGDTFDGGGPYDVELPDSGDATKTPLTEGASLVVIWSLPGRPYRGIVLFDGAFTLRPPNLGFNVNLAGFYQAATANAERKASLTHIVGGGQGLAGNLYFNGSPIASPKAFPGAQGASWDNRTFDVSALLPPNVGTATTSSDSTVLPPGRHDCVTWAAVAFSTTVQDTDKDGLLDTWEDNGFRDMERSSSQPTGAFVDLKAMGADKTKRDIFIEIDWMKAADHNHKPVAGALDDFAKAFTDQGIVPHLDLGASGLSKNCPARLCTGGEELPEVASVGFKGGLEAIKGANGPSGVKNFQDSRRFIFHYSLWAHQYSFKNAAGVDVDETSCGVADLPGGDTILAFGDFAGKVGTRQDQTGCFLHEFGHNLNLKHGGDEHRNYKPQYQSIMNYLYTLQGLTADDGKVTFDYSRRKLIDLNEARLTKAAGAGNALYRTRWFQKFAGGDDERDCGTNFRTRMTAQSGDRAIDWNGAAGATVDDYDIGGGCGVDAYSGFNDWPAIDLQQAGARPSYAINRAGVAKTTNPAAPVSRDISFQEFSQQPPNSPSRLIAARGGQGQAVLHWLPVQQQTVVEYRIYRFDSTAPTPPPFGTSFVGRVLLPGPTGDDLNFPSGPAFTSFTDPTPVSAGVSTLTYFVTAVSEYGVESDSSNLAVFIR